MIIRSAFSKRAPLAQTWTLACVCYNNVPAHPACIFFVTESCKVESFFMRLPGTVSIFLLFISLFSGIFSSYPNISIAGVVFVDEWDAEFIASWNCARSNPTPPGFPREMRWSLVLWFYSTVQGGSIARVLPRGIPNTISFSVFVNGLVKFFTIVCMNH